MGLQEHKSAAVGPIGFAIVTVSDTRPWDEDTGGAYLAQAVEEAGHKVIDRAWVRDEAREIEGALEAALREASVQFVLFTGGTGLAARDVTAETLEARYQRVIPGFGELFRWLSYEEIGAATILSRASAGVVEMRIVVALPGSPKALELAMTRILLPEAAHLVQQIRA